MGRGRFRVVCVLGHGHPLVSVACLWVCVFVLGLCVGVGLAW
jgi:hypothetical protein